MKMKKTLLVQLILLPAIINAQNKPLGTYSGTERMLDWSSGKAKPYIDKENSSYIWYHLSTFRFEGDSVFLEQRPIFIEKGDTVYSESDGAFYYYEGKIQKQGSVFIVTVQLRYCEYCMDEKYRPASLNKRLFTIVPGKSSFIINKSVFKKLR